MSDLLRAPEVRDRGKGHEKGLIPNSIDLCDEIIVVARGRVVCRLSGAQATESAIAAAASGGTL